MKFDQSVVDIIFKEFPQKPNGMKLKFWLEKHQDIKKYLYSLINQYESFTCISNVLFCLFAKIDVDTLKCKNCGKSIKMTANNIIREYCSCKCAANNEEKKLNLLIKGDVQGSIEALIGSLEKLNVEGVKVNVVRGAVGAITETDISLATVSKSIIIAFNVRTNAQIQDLAKSKGIEIRYYDIIYKLLEDIEAAMKGLLDPVYEEKVIGEAEVRETYKVSKIGTIAGCYVRNGIVQRNASVRLIRDSIVVYTGKISSLKRFKDDVKEVNQGFECGITIEKFNDIKVGDVFEIFELNEVSQ